MVRGATPQRQRDLVRRIPPPTGQGQGSQELSEESRPRRNPRPLAVFYNQDVLEDDLVVDTESDTSSIDVVDVVDVVDECDTRRTCDDDPPPYRALDSLLYRALDSEVSTIPSMLPPPPSYQETILVNDIQGFTSPPPSYL